MVKTMKANQHRLPMWPLVALLVSMALILAASIQAAAPPASNSEKQANESLLCRIGFKVPKMFDFANYKAKFHKAYHGFIEELTRQKYFMSRAIRAIIAAVKYRYRKTHYYLSVNWLSDASPAELERMRNRDLEQLVLAQESWPRTELTNFTSSMSAAPLSGQNLSLPEFSSKRPSEAQDEMRRLILEHGDEPGFRELKEEMAVKTCAKSRKKRETTRSSKVRNLPMSKLINSGQDATLSSESMRKMGHDYGSSGVFWQGSERPLGHQENVNVYTITAPAEHWQRLDPAGRVSSHTNQDVSANLYVNDPMDIDISGDPMDIDGSGDGMDIDDSSYQSEYNRQQPDEVFMDLRATNCFFPPRDQGHCASCYAFATTAVMEWLYCMRYGQLVAFSEQYIIDCGRGRVHGLHGCSGGTPSGCANFLHNYGLELLDQYPYLMRDDQCPYEEHVHPKTTGFLRAELNHVVALPLPLWPMQLASGPLWVGISLADDFFEYGGGVHGWGCHQLTATHAVLVVGHGRQDGLEYWLVRNSNSVHWGEGGYYKLAKEANCVHPRVGYKFGTTDGFNYDFTPNRNARYDSSRMRRRRAGR